VQKEPDGTAGEEHKGAAAARIFSLSADEPASRLRHQSGK